jgi:hypothetical protein
MRAPATPARSPIFTSLDGFVEDGSSPKPREFRGIVLDEVRLVPPIAG